HKPQDEHGQYMDKEAQPGIKKVFEHQGQDAQGDHIYIVLIVFHHQGGGKDHEQNIEKDKGQLVVVPKYLVSVMFDEKEQHEQDQGHQYGISRNDKNVVAALPNVGLVFILKGAQYLKILCFHDFSLGNDQTSLGDLAPCKGHFVEFFVQGTLGQVPVVEQIGPDVSLYQSNGIGHPFHRGGGEPLPDHFLGSFEIDITIASHRLGLIVFDHYRGGDRGQCLEDPYGIDVPQGVFDEGFQSPALLGGKLG